jgi:Protein of unknown function (DUF1552)
MNSISKLALPRRTVLRGLGAALALPLLDSMVPAFTPTVRTAARPIKRFGAIYTPNGMAMDYWTPKKIGPDFEFMPINAALAPFRDQVLLVSGLKLPWDAPHPSAPFLSGAVGNRGENNIACGISMDQIVARQFGHETQLASLELALENVGNTGQCSGGYSCVYSNTISWRDATTPLPMENNPRLVFERMFGDSTSTDAAARRERLEEDKSVLDAVLESLTGLKRKIGPGDRDRLEQYLEGVRDVERRVQKAEQQATRELPLVEKPGGIPASYGEHAKVMFDLQLLAYQTDLTRIVTFMMAREQSSLTYSEIGVPDSHHPLSHHAHEPSRVATMARINAYHVKLFADYVEKLKATPDGDGTLLDHVVLLYGSGISDSMDHLKDNLPLVLVGGGAGTIRGGRHLHYGATVPASTLGSDGGGVKAQVPPMSDLCLTLMDKLGVHLDRLGDSSGPLDIDSAVTL